MKILNSIGLFLAVITTFNLHAVIYRAEAWLNDQGILVIALSDYHMDSIILQKTLKQQDMIVHFAKKYGFHCIVEDHAEYKGNNKSILDEFAYYKYLHNMGQTIRCYVPNLPDWTARCLPEFYISPLALITEALQKAGVPVTNVEFRYISTTAINPTITVKDVADELNGVIKEITSFHSSDQKMQKLHNYYIQDMCLDRHQPIINLINTAALENPHQTMSSWFDKQDLKFQRKYTSTWTSCLLDVKIIHALQTQIERNHNRILVAVGGGHVDALQHALATMGFEKIDEEGIVLTSNITPRTAIKQTSSLNFEPFLERIMKRVESR